MEEIRHALEKSDTKIVALRGPLTLELVKHVYPKCLDEKVALGDPALLLPLIYPKKPSLLKNDSTLLIPHFKDFAAIRKILQESCSSRHEELYVFHNTNVKISLVYPGTDTIHMLHQIMVSGLVISSGLHPIIVAEAYGVGACWLHDITLQTGSNTCEGEGSYKFLDYYLGTGRGLPMVSVSLVDVLKGNARPLPPIDSINYAAIAYGLLSAFPLQQKNLNRGWHHISCSDITQSSFKVLQPTEQCSVYTSVSELKEPCGFRLDQMPSAQGACLESKH